MVRVRRADLPVSRTVFQILVCEATMGRMLERVGLNLGCVLLDTDIASDSCVHTHVMCACAVLHSSGSCVLYCPMFRYECSCSDWAEYIYLQIAAVFLLIFFTLALPVRCYMLIRANKPKGSREDPGMRYDEDGQLVECVLGSSGKRGVWLTRGGRVHAAGTLITCTTWTS